MGTISKGKRSRVIAKSEGRCWYCGDLLLGNNWDIDHVIPHNDYSREHKCLMVNGKKFTEYGLNSIKNLVPSCRACNLHKGSNNLEGFRGSILNQPEAKKINSAGFRIAQKYGIIKVIKKPIVFWFEKNNK